MPRKKRQVKTLDTISLGEEGGRQYFRYDVRPSGRYFITHDHGDSTVDIQAVDEHGNDLTEWHERVSKDSLTAA